MQICLFFPHKSFSGNFQLISWQNRTKRRWTPLFTNLSLIISPPALANRKEGGGSLHLPGLVAVIHFNLLYWLLFRLYWLTALQSLITGPEFYVTAAQTQSTGQIMLIPSHTRSAASLTAQIGPAPRQSMWQEILFPPEATGFFTHFHLTSAVWVGQKTFSSQ